MKLDPHKNKEKYLRNYVRLNSLKDRLIFLAKQFEDRFKVDLNEMSEEQVCRFLSEMGNGKIKKKDGQ
ncbi:MAG: hypothetical protein ABIB47_06590 [Candidatus Woesearchaeota archaeon]